MKSLEFFSVDSKECQLIPNSNDINRSRTIAPRNFQKREA